MSASAYRGLFRSSRHLGGIPEVTQEGLEPRPGGEWAASLPGDARVSLAADVFLYEAIDLDPADPAQVWKFSEALAHNVCEVWLDPRWTDVYDSAEGSWNRYARDLAPFSRAMGVQPVSARDLDQSLGFLHVSEVALRQSVLRDLADALRAQEAGEVGSLRPRWQQSFRMANVALSRFAPHFEAVHDGAGIEWGIADGDWIGDRLPTPTGFQVAVLQAHDRAASGLGAKRCARPACGRIYFTQRGRGKFSEAESHRRVDSIYCSASCAKRVGNQAWRERKRAARRAGE